MFREMRRKKQILNKEETELILKKRTSGVFVVNGDDGYPYAIPMSYVYHNNKIYMHSAKSGHKIDALMKNEKVSFTVIDQDVIVPEKFTTHFRSVVCFGKGRIVDSPEEKMETIKVLTRKYSPNMEEEMNKEISSGIKSMVMIAIDIEHMSGKEALELVKKEE